MRFHRGLTLRLILIAAIIIGLTVRSMRQQADTATCGGQSITVPFTDVMSSVFFCQIAEAYFSGLTNGTSETTYSPGAIVTREQMAAFITRTQDSALRRGSTRAALDQFWTTTPRYLSSAGGLGTTTVGATPALVQSDGADIWVANLGSGTVSRVRASDGKLLNSWTGATSAFGVLVARGRVFVTGDRTPGSLYMIDPTQTGGAVTVVSTALGNSPQGLTYDGSRIWTANQDGSVSIVTPTMATPWSVVNVTTGFLNPLGILFDGSNIWVTDAGANSLLKLDQNGAIVQTVNVDVDPRFPAFDGTNIWVPHRFNNSVSVVRAATGNVIATLTGNGLSGPTQAAFDGQRILITNFSGDSVSLWKAADLTPIGTVAGAATGPWGACSDGVSFWITLFSGNQVVRF